MMLKEITTKSVFTNTLKEREGGLLRKAVRRGHIDIVMVLLDMVLILRKEKGQRRDGFAPIRQ